MLRNMLLASAGQIEPKSDQVQPPFDKLLKKCDSLPLASNVADGGVRYLTNSHYKSQEGLGRVLTGCGQ